MSDKIVHVTDTSYQQDVLESKLPVIVDFWAPWCGPCRMLGPIIDDLAESYSGKLVFAKMNTDENPDTPAQLGIRGIPTLIVFHGGQEVDRMVGAVPKPRLASKIDALLAGLAEDK